ncbi:MAG: hypothetical protein LBR57_01925 [Alistipes sp.]|jgi:hypothetical protein|nr:hypothetical protein [Alistipes sp.]
MTSITLTYDERDQEARMALENLLSRGFVRKKLFFKRFLEDVGDTTRIILRRPGAKLRKAIRDVERGDVTHCGSFENYLKMTGGNA